MNSLRTTSLLAGLWLACGSDLGEPTCEVTSAALESPCATEKKARDDAHAALLACLNLQMEQYQYGRNVPCDAQERRLAIAEWNLRSCLSGSDRRISCACELPDLRPDGGRRYRCDGPDGGCRNPDAGVDAGPAPVR
ncbi:MAG: hypothetical protein JNK82_19890 [Myxococcaceae bacterium]|nr:hypothetical protein [Myxococcaceae bacterium]